MADGLGHPDRDPMKRRGEKMRSVLITAAALVALAGPAEAAARHTWYSVDFDEGTCTLSQLTPEQAASQNGFDRITPNDVRKDADGDLSVIIHGNFGGKPYVSSFFSSKAKCEALVGPLVMPIDSDAEAAYCLKNEGQPTFAKGKWNKCIVKGMGNSRKPITVLVRDLEDAALCSLAAGTATMANGGVWGTCSIP
jgi:hypothetical protein